MPAPYRPSEIAEAVLETARRDGVRIQSLTISADEGERVWAVRVNDAEGESHSLVLPFSTPLGLSTPTELAAVILGNRWPFGWDATRPPVPVVTGAGETFSDPRVGGPFASVDRYSRG